MISLATFYGRVRQLSTGSSTTLGYGVRLYIIGATASGRTFTLPDARKLQVGWGSFNIFNYGPTNAYAINNNAAGSLVASLAVGDIMIGTLLSNATAAGTWLIETKTKLT